MLPGPTIEKDKEKGFAYLFKAAELGYTQAETQVGHSYLNGFGTKRDLDKAVIWSAKAARKGAPNALENLCVIAYIYHTGKKGFKIEKDPRKAFEAYKIAAGLNYHKGQYNLGVCYEFGIHVKIDLDEAKKWYKRAADQGDFDSKKRLKILEDK